METWDEAEVSRVRDGEGGNGGACVGNRGSDVDEENDEWAESVGWAWSEDEDRGCSRTVSQNVGRFC